MPNVYDLMRSHVSLSIGCIDRLYLNGYIPRLQTAAQLFYFLTEHLGGVVASPAQLLPIHDRFVEAVEAFSKHGGIPMIPFARKQRKDEVVKEFRSHHDGQPGVVVIGVAQEKESSFRGSKQVRPDGSVWFRFSRQPVFVKQYYFYLQDEEWGPGFVKVGTYLPYPVKVCLNGHEWVKQRLRKEIIPFEALDNGFLSCAEPERLQQICDQIGPADLEQFFDRWKSRLPWPLTPADRAAGYDHRLALWQMEVSLTQVFDRPVQGRHFFEEVIRENLDLGRPDRVSLLFPTKWKNRTAWNRRTPSPKFGYKTRVITEGVEPSLHASYKHCDIKQYFKEGRALRTETTINDPTDFNTNKGLANLPYLRRVGAQANQKLLEIERLSHNCVLTQDGLDRLQKPTRENGHRASALRFGDIRVMALLQALCTFDHVHHGFRHRDLRPRMAALLGTSVDAYSQGRMTYDLRRLRRKRLISRVPGQHRYVVTTYGLKVALFLSKLYLRVLRPHWPDVETPVLSRPLARAYAAIETVLASLLAAANLQPA